ncbi:hypothetical protein BSKO_11678 [Bryopsis sp. KO-2023]|nr:hypothetical protein BSKO_11678 [Bryopsis sp. KO-2023]
MGSPQRGQSLLYKELAISAVSSAVGTMLTNPLDVIKVRQQMRGLILKTGDPAPGVFRTAIEIVQKEGVVVLASGVGASAVRGVFHGGLRLGLYTPIKRAMGAEGKDISLSKKIMAGGSAGAIAAACANPMDLIKTRLQSKQGKGKSISTVMREVTHQEGFAGFWRGLGPSISRSSVLTASQCATYDEVKHRLMRVANFKDSFATHLASSMITGLVSTTATTPIDVIKTQMMVRGGSFQMEYLYKEGVSGLFKGWGASYIRIGPHTMIVFLTLELLRSYCGLESL